MPGLHDLDPAAHLRPAFRDAFRTWPDLTAYLGAYATTAAFDTDRAVHQLLMVDLLARFTAVDGFGWVLRGSLSLPARPAPRTRGPRAGIAAVYTAARPALDLDLCATALSRGDPADRAATGQLLRGVAEQIIDTGGHAFARHGAGLGGLVHYSSNDLRVLATGRVVAPVTAMPLDPRRSSALRLVPADDPVTVHIDLTTPGSLRITGAPERAQRPILAIAVPGFADIRPNLYPTVNQIADKLALVATPHWNPPWHRFKDLFDLRYLTANCRLTAGELRTALATNPNLARHGLTALPRPYRLHGQQPSSGEHAVEWEAMYERLRVAHPALAGYPPFGGVLAEITDLVEQLHTAPDGALWSPTGRQWTEITAERQPRTPLPPPRPEAGRAPGAAALAPQQRAPATNPGAGRRPR